MSTVIIAEMASAHDGELDKALRLVDAGAEAGADIVKAEFWSDPDAMADRRHVPDQFREHYRRHQVPPDWLPVLRSRCFEKRVGFMCSTYLTQDIWTVAPFVSLFKVAGFEAQDQAFLRAHEPYGKAVVVSVPLSVAPPSRWQRGIPFILLHCVQAYPVAEADLHLDMIRAHHLDGFSDHSGLIDAGAAAVLAGAKMVEAHLKLKETDPANYDGGPHAHTPDAFRQYVAAIRRADRMRGNGAKLAHYDCEADMAKYRVTA